MARIAYFGLPARGHRDPAIKLLTELKKRGEQIIYYSGSACEKDAVAAGFMFKNILDHPLFGDADYFNQSTEYSNHKQPDMFKKIASLASANLMATKFILERFTSHLKCFPPDYIIHDSFSIWGKKIAQILKIPAVSSITTFAFSEYVFEYFPLEIARQLFQINIPFQLTREEQNEFNNKIRRKLKALKTILPVIENSRVNDIFDLFINREQLNIVYTSKHFQIYNELFDDSYQFVGPVLMGGTSDPDFPLEKLSNRKVIYISLGTIFNRNLEFFKKCVQAFKNSEWLVVMSIGEKLDLSSMGLIPENFIVKNKVPQIDVLKKSQLFITHGGMNSANEAIYYGIPQLVIPQEGDQYMVAWQVEKLKVGIFRNNDISEKELRDTAMKLTCDPSYHENTLVIRKTFEKAGGIKQAADKIFAYTRR